MSIEDLLSQLEAERAELEIKYRNYHEKAAEALREIKSLHFLSPEEDLFDLRKDYEKYSYLYAIAASDHNEILTAINVIKKRVS